MGNLLYHDDLTPQPEITQTIPEAGSETSSSFDNSDLTEGEHLSHKLSQTKCNLSKNILTASKNLLIDSSIPKENNLSLSSESKHILHSQQQAAQFVWQGPMEKLLNNGGERMLQSNKSAVVETLPVDQTRFIKIKYGPILDDYVIMKEIGCGSFGKVYEAREKRSKEPRAVKKLFKGKLKKSEYSSLLNELQILKKMDHPNIIKLYDIYEDSKWLYVVTELCKGGNLLELISNFELTEEEVRIFMTQILSAVTYMHSNRIIHRDIKLENVVLVKQVEKLTLLQSQTKLIDFGISVDMAKKTKDQRLVGTLMYIPPESFDGVITMAWDVWSCGILCYKLATRKIPYMFNDDEEVLRLKIRKGAINNYHLSKKSSELRKFINNMLIKNYRFRISSKKALKDDWLCRNESRKQRLSQQNVDKMMSSLNKYTVRHFIQKPKNSLVTVVEGYLVATKVNQAQRQELASLFQSIDHDRSGIIEIDEFKTFFREHSASYDENEVEELIRVIDNNKSGKIDFHEFITAMCERRQLFQLESLSEAFDFFDIDSSGSLSLEEVKDLLKGVENQQLQGLFCGLDQNGDQKISKEEFLSYFNTMINQ